MTRRKRKPRPLAATFVELARELRIKLHEMDQKLDHLIKSYRKFYLTTDFSHSTNHEFRD